MGREGRERVLEDKTDVVTTRKEAGRRSMGEVQGTPTSYLHTTKANGMGREGKGGDINCRDKGTALVTSSTAHDRT